jgi:regulator of nucleoside diphosphate kinase
MKYGKLVLEKSDFALLKQYQRTVLTYKDYAHKNTLDTLKNLMSKAIILEAERMPSDVIQLYSKITVTCNSQWQEEFTLVAPSEENIKKNKTSVMSTLGASLIGISEGDSIKYGLPGSTIFLKIETVVTTKIKANLSPSKAEASTSVSQDSRILTLKT